MAMRCFCPPERPPPLSELGIVALNEVKGKRFPKTSYNLNDRNCDSVKI